jgi:ATP-dependent helicase/DNAse subunit B
VELDLERYFDQCVKWGASYEPRHFELEFGWGEGGRLENDPEHALALADGRLRLHGRVDRVDVDEHGSRAIVYDYKGRAVDKPDDWLERRTLQLPLYMIAARELLDVEPVGGFYQPIGARPNDRKARGVLVDGADDAIDSVRGDRRDADEVRELLDAVVGLALDAIAGIEAGAVQPRPLTCSRDGGCAHPSICRLEPS